MLEHQEFAEVSRFVLELTAMDDSDNDLDSLLARLLEVLQKQPALCIQPKGVVRLYNPRGAMISVAQHGLHPIWLDPAADARLARVPQTLSTSVFTAPLEARDRVIVLPLVNEEHQLGQAVIFIEPEWEPSETEIAFMAKLARALSTLVGRCVVNETLKVREFELEEMRAQTIRSLGEAAECRDHEVGMHVMRMSNFSVVIAKAYGLSDEQRELLYITAPLHDVGKIGIADGILLKPDRLTEHEFDIMKTHTEIGERLLRGSDTLIIAAREIASSHHENWDGSGYPRGLRGDEIPVLARICAVADVFDALISARPYKEAWSLEDATAWIIGQAGRKFDPAVVRAFEAALPEIVRIRELYREDIINPNQIVNLTGLVHRDTRWISWDESLSVGIDVIDEHHRYLFDLANDLIDIVARKRGAREVGRVLKALGQYAQVHFHAEERMMEHYGCQWLNRQRGQHRQFTEKLQEFSDELHDNPLVAQFEVMAYLRGWLAGHIRHEDAHFKELVTHYGCRENEMAATAGPAAGDNR
ncbi:bacteriohemerythrin [Geobacter sp. SVR]|uniref:bacteriohemerythrin n=1 Tax=Geobacter sp. SVR TaxID=2495594 RepID=UPI00143EF5F9|nr:bacteriohemerythrin [Geobacter sp. SVR]BCS51743.1 hypothetical protein GSVR_00510 [Geobacter sp. SVR]GCF84930.1 hypothetical protein GSbR_15300 [Geobacter sp. SVR]